MLPAASFEDEHVELDEEGDACKGGGWGASLRGGIRSLIASRPLASSNEVILWLGENPCRASRSPAKKKIRLSRIISSTRNRWQYRSAGFPCHQIGHPGVRIRSESGPSAGARFRSLPYTIHQRNQIFSQIFEDWQEKNNERWIGKIWYVTSAQRIHGPSCQWLGSCYGWPPYERQLLVLTKNTISSRIQARAHLKPSW